MNNTYQEFQLAALTWIAQMLGLQVSELSTDMHLDADLALDSIKMMGLMSQLSEKMHEYGHPIDGQGLGGDVIMSFQTLGDIVTFLAGKVGLEKTSPEKINSPEVFSDSSAEQDQPTLMPILHSQYVFMVSRFIADTSALCHSLRLRGVIDIERAQIAWQQLVDRHPVLRCCFKSSGTIRRLSDYQFQLHTHPQVPVIPCVDIRHLEAKAKEQRIEDNFIALLNRPWDLQEWPLHHFSLLQVEDEEFVLFLASDHAISDGLGNQTMMREFLQLYSGESLGAPTSSEFYCQTVEGINQHQDPQEDRWLQDYLQNQGRDTFIWQPDKTSQAFNKHVKRDEHYRNRVYQLSGEQTQALKQQAAAWNVPLNSVLLAYYLKVLCELSPEQETPVILQVPTSGKIYPGVDAAGVLGPFAQNMALSFEPVKAHESTGDLLTRVDQTIQQALSQGIDRAQTIHIAQLLKNTLVFEQGQIPPWLVGVLDSSVKSNIYVPYTGNTYIRSDYDALKVIDYRAGTYNRPGTIDLQQEVFDDRLHVFVNFDSGCFAESAIDQLANAYLDALKSFAHTPVARSSVAQENHDQHVAPDLEILNTLCNIANSVLTVPIDIGDVNKDIEAEFGVDSIERVRIMTRILGDYQQRVDRKILFQARTLAQMAAAIDDHANPQLDTPNLATQGATINAARADNIEPDSREVITLGKQYPEVPYLHFMAQAKARGDAIAVASDTAELSYQQLDELSNQLAHTLYAQGAREGHIIALMCERGPHMVVGMMAIVKTGAAYLPIDPSLPGDRIATMLGLAKADCLVCESAVALQLLDALSASSPIRHIVSVDEYSPMIPMAIEQQWQQINKSQWGQASTEPLAVQTNPDALMAVLFTSGSTGQPKAIMTSHRSYMNRLRWHQKTFQLAVGERVSQNTSCSFDISIREIFWPLMVGGCVCPVEQSTVSNPWLLAEWLQEKHIHVFQFVPSLFSVFVQAMAQESWQFPDLRWLLFSTEPLPVNLVRQWIDRFGMSIGIANQYGPSECAIESTCHIVTERPPEDQLKMSIGYPIDNVHVVIVDQQGQRLANNQLGEIYIGGVQLAQGYLDNQEATEQAFVANPFNDIPGEKLYRTGDLGMFLDDGSLSFHGRRDNQIKIRGNRVELGEVEAVLAQHQAVKEVAVLVVEVEGKLAETMVNGAEHKKLVAWLVGEGKHRDAEVKAWLAKRLPDYMQPHHILWLERMPRNHNGKIERQSLRKQYRQAFAAGDNTPAVVMTDEYLPLGPGQRWLVSHFSPPYQWWGMMRYRVKQPVDVQAFGASVRDLIDRHAILRTVFVERDQQLLQRIMPPGQPLSPPVEYLDACHLSDRQTSSAIDTLAKQFANALDIGLWPLMKLWVVKREDETHDICIVAHHLIADMVSGHIMFRELWDHYAHHVIEPIAASGLNRSPAAAAYGDLVKALQTKEANGELEKDWHYWNNSLQQALAFTADNPEGDNSEATSRCCHAVLAPDISDQLLRYGKRAFNASLHSILLAPWYVLLARQTRQQSIVLSHRMSGRQLENNALTYSQSLGNFAVNFPVAIHMNLQNSWPLHIQQIHSAFAELPCGGLSYDWLSPRLPKTHYPDHRRSPIRINYLGQADSFDSDLFDIDWDAANQRFIPEHQQRSAEIEVWLLFKNKQLHVDIYYSHERYKTHRMETLLQEYLTVVSEMMAHGVVMIKPETLQDRSE